MNTGAMQLVMLAIAMCNISHNNGRAVIAALLSVSSTVHFYAFKDASDIMYYVSACSVDVLCAFILMQIRSTVAIDVAAVSIASAVVNLVVLLLWFAYIPPDVYNVVIKVIIGLQIARILLVTDDDMAGAIGVHRWHNLVRSDYFSSGGRVETSKS